MVPDPEAQIPEPQLAAYKRSSLLFGLSGGLMLTAVVALFVVQRGLFQRHMRVQVVVPTTQGLPLGTPVRLSGIRIGLLERWSLLPDGRVTLTLRINDRYRAWVSPRSTARISTKSLLSDAAVDLAAAPMDPRRVPDHFSVTATRSVGMETLLSGVEGTRTELNRLLRSTQRIADRELPAALRGVEGVMASSTSLARTIERDIPPTTAELRTTLRTFDRTGRAATQTSDTVTRSVTQLTPELQASLQEFSRLMQRSNALLRRMQGLFDPAELLAPPRTSAPSPSPLPLAKP